MHFSMGEGDLAFINDVDVPPRVPYRIFFVIFFNLQNGKSLVERSLLQLRFEPGYWHLFL